MSYCGVLNVDKPTGLTSREIVDRVVPLVRPAKVGHAGTLDPLASGVLVLCVGHATRLINLVQEGKKTYRGRFRLGQQSDTDDITGNVTAGGDWSRITRGRVEEELNGFIGRIEQVPPDYSAVHVEGRRAYKLARRGEQFELTSKSVDVYSIRLTCFKPPDLELDIECGSGTYIRSIGRDLGLKLGCGAVMTELRRTVVGTFDVSNSISPVQLTAGTLQGLLQSPLEIVANLPQRLLTADELQAIRCGRPIPAGISPQTLPLDRAEGGNRTAMIGPAGQLIGIAEYEASKQLWQPRIVFPTDPSTSRTGQIPLD